MSDKTVCPKCRNTIGFTFGTCSDCGWNYLDNTYHHIKIYTSDLPQDIRHRLENLHDKRVLESYGWRK